jgi:peptide/nickel transport system substrate-binding protein
MHGDLKDFDSLSLMKAGMSRRGVIRVLGASGMALSLGGLLAACAEDDDVADGPASASAEDDAVHSDAADDEPVEESDDADAEETGESDDEAEQSDDDRPVLIVAVQGLPDSLDPHQHLSNVGTRVTYSLFDHLFERDFHASDPPGSGFGVSPMLSTDWERIDELTLEVRLRDDVLFHNGDPMTAEDIKFSFDRMLVDTPDELQGALGYVSTISEVEIVDDYTLRFTTEEPDPILENRLTSWATWIMPKAYYEEVGMEGFMQNPVGTGPYRFVELRPDDLLVFEAFDDYWGGRPTASRIEFRVIPETSGRVSAVISGEAHIATNIPPDQVGTLEDASGVGVSSIPIANCHVLVYNTYQPAIEDKRIRQAMNLGIDRELLVDTLWGGRAVLMRSHQFEEYPDELYNADRPFLPYDPEQAMELLDEAGYDGEEVTFSTHAAYYTFGQEAAQAIVEMWNEIGINASVVVREDMFAAPPEEIVVRNWSNSSFTADPDGAFWLRWGPGTAPQNSFWTPENPRFNERGEQARQTLDTEFRYAAYQEMLDIWEDEAPGTVLYIPMENYAIRDEVDWTPYSFYYMDLRPGNFSFH